MNLATGEEEYNPDTDITVYNPVGPSVAWGREYRSLRSYDPSYEYLDYGIGWSQPYNEGVYDPNFTINRTSPVVPAGSDSSFPQSGSDTPASGTWDIKNPSGTVIANSSTPNGWSVLSNVQSSHQFTVSAPSTASVGNGYEVRYIFAGPDHWSAIFGVASSSTPGNGQVPQGHTGTAQVVAVGSAVTGESWQITNNGVGLVAESSSPNGWSVSANSNGIVVTAPSTATIGQGYVVSYGFNNPVAAYFDVITSTGTGSSGGSWFTYSTTTSGTKYVYMPNGARLPFNAPSVPSSTNQTVTCTASAGYPFLVKWLYDTNSPVGHYVITWPDRTQWTVYPGLPDTENYTISQIADRNGNYITFSNTLTYSGAIINSISNQNGTTLLTINRTSSEVASVSDCYGRSVYYHIGSYTPVNDGGPWPELDQVSQIVTTGSISGSIPSNELRYSYGYTNVATGEGSIEVPFMTSIVVPSPTGTGNATSTINYSSTTDLVTSIVDANGNTRTYTSCNSTGGSEYPSNYTEVTVTNPSNQVVYSYIAGWDNNMSQTIRTNGAGTIISTYTYSDPNDPFRPSSAEDGNGNIWTYTWDKYGNVTSSTTPRNTTTSYSVSYTNFALGELTEVQSGTKAPTYYAYYEPSGLVRAVTLPLPGTTGSVSTVQGSFTYDSLGNILTITAPAANNTPGATITFTLNYTSDSGNSTYGISPYSQSDAIGQPLTLTDNLGKVTHYRYDSEGNCIAHIDAIGNEISHSFNIANQPIQDEYPKTGQQGTGNSYRVSTYLYPDGPLMSAATYDESNTQVAEDTHSYGYEGEMLGMAGSVEPVTYTYDALYRLATVKDGNGNETSYSYNIAGYLAEVVYPGATSTTTGSADTISYTSYDNDGNVLKRIDGNNIETDYSYADAESKLTKTHYPGGGLSDVNYSYDSYGRRSTMGDGTGSQSYVYDDLNDLLSDTTNFTSGPTNQMVSYTYYPNGSREAVVTPSGTFSDSYDNDGRLTGITNPFGEASSWSYLDNNWLNTQTLGNGAYTAYTYNALGEITDLVNKNSSGTTLSDFGSMAYNGASDRTTVTASMPADTTYAGTTTYSYDSISGIGTRNQLTQEASSRNGGYTNNFAYDGGGYSSSTGAGNPTTMRGNSHSFNIDNQLTDPSFNYDGNGNPTTYAGNTLTFDPENRMTAYGSILSAGYNGDGLRAWKQNSSGTTYYVYDGSQLVCEENSVGTVTATNTFGINGLLSRDTSSGSVFYTFDEQGSIAQRLDSSQNVLTSHIYDAFGSGTSSGTFSDPFGYGAQAGYYTDNETGLILCTHRYYDPSVGRWLNRDPISYAGGINLYGYVKNNPCNGSDILGLKCNCWWPAPPGSPYPVWLQDLNNEIQILSGMVMILLTLVAIISAAGGGHLGALLFLIASILSIITGLMMIVAGIAGLIYDHPICLPCGPGIDTNPLPPIPIDPVGDWPPPGIHPIGPPPIP